MVPGVRDEHRTLESLAHTKCPLKQQLLHSDDSHGNPERALVETQHFSRRRHSMVVRCVKYGGSCDLCARRRRSGDNRVEHVGGMEADANSAGYKQCGYT